MSSELQRRPAPPEQPRRRVSTRAKRFGYVLAAVVNGVMLWAAHQLLDWGWPGFLTDDFELMLGLVTASFIASIAVNLALAVHHRGRVRSLADIVTAAFGLAVGLRTWEVSPFDFSGYATDWSSFVHVALVIGIAATGIALIVNLVKFVASSEHDA